MGSGRCATPVAANKDVAALIARLAKPLNRLGYLFCVDHFQRLGYAGSIPLRKIRKGLSVQHHSSMI
jgi:hypothetical protein